MIEHCVDHTSRELGRAHDAQRPRRALVPTVDEQAPLAVARQNASALSVVCALRKHANTDVGSTIEAHSHPGVVCRWHPGQLPGP